MFYILYLGFNTGFDNIRKYVKDLFYKNSIIGTEIYKDLNEELGIWCNWFSVNIKTNTHGIVFTSQDYSLSLKYQFWFELLSSVEGASEKMMYVIGRLLEQTEGDAILLSNGDTPILERRNGIVIVDDTKLHGQKRFPFDKLGIEYAEGELKQM